jgi:hypothetical protein
VKMIVYGLVVAVGIGQKNARMPRARQGWEWGSECEKVFEESEGKVYYVLAVSRWFVAFLTEKWGQGPCHCGFGLLHGGMECRLAGSGSGLGAFVYGRRNKVRAGFSWEANAKVFFLLLLQCCVRPSFRGMAKLSGCQCCVAICPLLLLILARFWTMIKFLKMSKVSLLQCGLVHVMHCIVFLLARLNHGSELVLLQDRVIG